MQSNAIRNLISDLWLLTSDLLPCWEKFFAVCDCVPLNTLAEAEEVFAGFEPIED